VEYRPGLSAAISYMEEAARMFAALWAHNIAVDVVSPDTPLEGYKLVVAPLLHMLSAGQAAAIERYVAGGGAFLTTFFSAIVGEDGRAWLGGSPGPLRKALGVWVEEVDPLLPGERNTLHTAAEGLALGGACDLWCEVVHLEGARALATFGEDFYAGRPAVTEHRFGAGRGYYVATRPEPAVMARLMGAVAEAAGVQQPLASPEGVEVVQRRGPGGTFTFVLNHCPDEQTLALPAPMRDLLSGEVYERELRLPARGVALLKAEG
jgi:beta-galactosidase